MTRTTFNDACCYLSANVIATLIALVVALAGGSAWFTAAVLVILTGLSVSLAYDAGRREKVGKQ